MSKNSGANKQHNPRKSEKEWKPSKGASQRKAQQRQRRQQPKKDSNVKRVNFDNTRVDKVADRIMDDARSGKFNDINDFLKNPTLVAAAARIPVFPILGQNHSSMGAVPSCMAFQWVPTVGTLEAGSAAKVDPASTSPTAPKLSKPPFAINQAKDSTYSFLVHANSRNYNYNSSDLFMLIMAGMQVFCAIQAMKRAYGLIKTYVETSRYTPDSLLIQQGFDPNDMRESFSHMWFDINLLINQTRQIWLPNEFPIFNRWLELNTNIYKDSDGPYAQIYQYVQTQFWIYDEYSIKTGGACIPVELPNADGTATEVFAPGTISGAGASAQYKVYSWKQWCTVVQNMINALVNSEDRGIIYGDLLNAYTAERIYAMPEIAADYITEISYSPEIAMQVENSVIAYGVPAGIMQVENQIYPLYKDLTKPTSRTQGPSNWPINFHTVTDPTPEMILLATRFMSLGSRAAYVPKVDSTATDGYSAMQQIVPLTHGSELLTGASFLIEPANSADQGAGKINGINSLWRILYGSDVSPDYCRAEAFDWHPFVGVFRSNAPVVPLTDDSCSAGTEGGTPIVEAFGDWDRYGDVTPNELKKINDVAILSLFNVPNIM